jgi:hypothetical protein
MSKDIEYMYEEGSPHYLFRPGHREDLEGANQPAAVQGLLIGHRPPPGVCTHRILFDHSVEVGLYSGACINIRRNGPPPKERECNLRFGAPPGMYELGAKLANAAAFGLPE